MPQGHNDENPDPASRLAELLNERGVSVRSLAKKLAGDGADAKRIDDVRGYVYRWLRGGGISEDYALQLGALLDAPPEWFRPSRPAPIRSVAARLAALEAMVDDLTTMLRAAKQANQRLAKRVSALESAAPAQEGLPETRSTRRGASGR